MDTQNNIAEVDVDLDTLLSGLEVLEEDVVSTDAVSEDLPETIEEPELEEQPVELAASDDTVLDEETAAAIEAEMELQDAREEIYASQEADSTDLDAQPETNDEPAPAAAAKPARAAKTVRTPRVSVESLPVDAFVLTSDIPDDLEANKAAVLRACPAQKKVKEKFDNILVAIHQGKAPSTYIMDCFRALTAKGGEITSLDLVAALKATSLKNGSGNYSEGTARSQVGQIMALFPALKIAARAGNKLTLNENSLLAEALRNVDAPPVEEEIPAVAIEEPAEDEIADELRVNPAAA